MIKELETMLTPTMLLLVSGVAWLIRLESKVMYLDKDHREHKSAVKENEKLMWKEIKELQTDIKQVLLTLARIEESLRNRRE